MATPQHTLWLDFETTGLDPRTDEVVEVGAIVTTMDLVQVGPHLDLTFTPSADGYARMTGTERVRSMHVASGLLARIDAGATYGPSSSWPTVLAQYLDATVGPRGLVVLGGSGVASFDLQFIRAQAPAVAKRLTYWTADIGPVRRAYRNATGAMLVEVNNDKTHRGIDDVRCHLAEARAFRDFFARAAEALDAPRGRA